MSNQTILAVIVPCYNEELVVESTAKTLIKVLNDLHAKEKISDKSYIYFIDDGSGDKTWSILENLHEQNPVQIKATKFVKNYGNQKALVAGLMSVNEVGCDCVISIDADLQQDVNAIERFIDEFHNGSEIVLGIRNNRKTDSFFKKSTALCFYKLMNILGVKIPPNHSDFRLVSKKALNMLDKYQEKELFLRGFFHNTGLKTSYVHFDVSPRMAGCSKFNVFTLTSLALNGITSYSIVPLRLISALGCFTVFVSIIMAFMTIIDKYILHNAPHGWATLVMLLLFFGGLQIFCLGVIGEYVGQIFNEVKSRPRYIKEKELN